MTFFFFIHRKKTIAFRRINSLPVSTPTWSCWPAEYIYRFRTATTLLHVLICNHGVCKPFCFLPWACLHTYTTDIQWSAINRKSSPFSRGLFWFSELILLHIIVLRCYVIESVSSCTWQFWAVMEEFGMKGVRCRSVLTLILWSVAVLFKVCYFSLWVACGLR